MLKTCPVCEVAFTAKPSGPRHCSHSCAMRARWSAYVRPPAPTRKRCASCERVLPLNQFYPTGNGSRTGRHAYCKPCFRDYMKTRYIVATSNRGAAHDSRSNAVPVVRHEST